MTASAPRYLSDFEPHTIIRDYLEPESGLRLLVVRGPFSFCAYVGVKADHALAGLEELAFRCHWGITFQQWGAEGTSWEPGWYWWGWDYAHFGDRVSFGPEIDEALKAATARVRGILGELEDRTARGLSAPKNWTVEEVFEDGLDVLMELRASLEHSSTLTHLLSCR